MAVTAEHDAPRPPGTPVTAALPGGASLAVYREIFRQSTDGIALIGLDGCYVEQNDAHRALLGYTDADLVGKTPAIHLGEAAFAQVAAILAATGRYRGELQSRARDGTVRYLELSAFSVFDGAGAPAGYVGIKRDVTARRRAQEDLQRHNAIQQALYRLSVAVSRAGDLETIYACALDELLGTLGADRAAVLLFDDDGVLQFRAWRGLSDTYRAAVAGHSPWPREARDPQPVLVPHAPSDEALAPYRALLAAEGIGALGFIPLVAQGQLLGKFMIYFDQPHAFTAEEVQLAETIARHVALAIERQHARARLEASEERLRIIISGVAEAITAQTPDRRLVFANDAAARLLGYGSPAALLAAPPGSPLAAWQMLDEDGRPFVPADLPGRRALAGEPEPQRVIRYRPHAGGEDRWSLVRSQPVRDAAGQVVMSITVAQDITSLKRAEARLRFLAEVGALLPAPLDMETTLTAVARTAVDTLCDWCAVFLVSEGGAAEGAGPAVGATAVGLQRVVAAHRDPARQAVVDLISRFPVLSGDASLLRNVLQTGQSVLVPEVPRGLLAQAIRDPEHLRLVEGLGLTSALWVPLAARGRTIGAIGLFTAESRRRLTDEDRALAEEIARRASLAVDNARLFAAERAAREAAETAVTARDEFLSIASHELRTPVTTIKGSAQLIQRLHARGTLDAERLPHLLDAIVHRANRLAALTDDLLDVSRLRDGLLRLRLQEIDVTQMLADLVQRQREQLDGRHQIRFTPNGGGRLRVTADGVRLEQVLTNLLSNAVKYSPEGGGVDVAVHRDVGGVLVEVHDQGIGLPPGSEETIFKPFGRAPNAAARQIPGMGLGLHVAREIVARHGGRIWAESPGEDRGTTLRLWLPLATALPAPTTT